MGQESAFKLIVTIVNKGQCGRVLDASKEAGAEGGTIMHGRGSGIHEQAKLFSFTIEPEKDIVLTLVPKELVDNVLDSIIKGAELDQPGQGVAFVLDVGQIAGVNHPISRKIPGAESSQ